MVGVIHLKLGVNMWRIRNFIFSIRRVIKWLPVIWKDRDYDHYYLMYLIKHKLLLYKKYYENNWDCGGHGLHTFSIKIEKINTLLRLWDKIVYEEYELEYIDTLEELYGKEIFKFVKTEKGIGYYLKSSYEDIYSDVELSKINELRLKLMEQGIKKGEKAQKLFWKMLGFYSNFFWD